MNNDHPSEIELLEYLDGELPAAESESVRRHLDACWSCRMHADRIETAILEFARYRERTPIPDPPAPWKDLAGDLRRIEESEVRSGSWWDRIKSGAGLRTGRLGFFFAVASAVAATTWFMLPKTRESRRRAYPCLQRPPRLRRW